MLFSQYCRIETIAGGTTCSRRDFLKACRSVLSEQGKSRAMRDQRHQWLREGLKQHENAQRVYLHCTKRGF